MSNLKPLTLQLNFIIALIGTLLSLVFSEVFKYPPCTLCWYQRICLYPLVVIFAISIWTGDFGYKKYALPFVLLGLTIAIYHNLLYFGVIAEPLIPCTADISCSAKQLELFGFLTIPLMSLTGFVMIATFLAIDANYQESV